MKGKTINYDFYQNPSQTTNPDQPQYHLRINNNQVVDLQGIGERLQKFTTATIPDIMAVVTGIRQILVDELSCGNTVSIDGICKLEPILGVSGGDCRGNERGGSVQLKTLRVHAVKSLIEEVRGQLKPCTHQRAKHSSSLVEDEVYNWLTTYFQTNDFITCSKLQDGLSITRYMATKYLKKFVSEGKLLRPTNGCATLYMPAPGFFGRHRAGSSH